MEDGRTHRRDIPGSCQWQEQSLVMVTLSNLELLPGPRTQTTLEITLGLIYNIIQSSEKYKTHIAKQMFLSAPYLSHPAASGRTQQEGAVQSVRACPASVLPGPTPLFHLYYVINPLASQDLQGCGWALHLPIGAEEAGAGNSPDPFGPVTEPPASWSQDKIMGLI